MRYPLRKERPYLFSPAAMVSLQLDIGGNVAARQLRSAIKTALRANELMCTHIVLTESGEAYFESIDIPCCPIYTTAADWPQLIAESERNPFDLSEGELARFYIIEGDPLRLLICAHQIIGGGRALACLARDIMSALNGDVLDKRPIELCDPDAIPGTLPISARLNARMMSLRWKYGGRAFSFSDMARLHDMYPVRSTLTARRTLKPGCSEALEHMFNESGAGLDAMLMTALLSALGERACVGFALALRDDVDYMGDFGSGISLEGMYDPALSFAANAKVLQSEVTALLSDPNRSNYRLKYDQALEPTLVDASYFAAFDGYGDPIARQIAQMRGLTEDEGINGLSSLRPTPMEQCYGEYELLDCAFVPPLVPSALRVLGVAALDRRIVLTLRARQNASAEAECALLERVACVLERACGIE